jgi:hypothetical protein
LMVEGKDELQVEAISNQLKQLIEEVVENS